MSQSAQRAYAQGNMDQRSLADFETTALDRRIEALALERSLGETRDHFDRRAGAGPAADPHRPGREIEENHEPIDCSCDRLLSRIGAALAPPLAHRGRCARFQLQRVGDAHSAAAGQPAAASSSVMARWSPRPPATRPSWLPWRPWSPRSTCAWVRRCPRARRSSGSPRAPRRPLRTRRPSRLSPSPSIWWRARASSWPAHLATVQQLADAEKAESDARSQLQALDAVGAGGPHVIRAPFRAIVTTLSTTPGSIVAEGAALLDLAAPQSLVLNVGVVPAQAAAIQANDAVAVQAHRRGSARARQECCCAERWRRRIPGSCRWRSPCRPAASCRARWPRPPSRLARCRVTWCRTRRSSPTTAAIPTSCRRSTEWRTRCRCRCWARTEARTSSRGKLDARAPLVLSGNYQLDDGMKVRLANSPPAQGAAPANELRRLGGEPPPLPSHDRIRTGARGCLRRDLAARRTLPGHELPAHPRRDRCGQHAGAADAGGCHRAARAGGARGARCAGGDVDDLARLGGDVRQLPLGL